MFRLANQISKYTKKIYQITQLWFRSSTQKGSNFNRQYLHPLSSYRISLRWKPRSMCLLVTVKIWQSNCWRIRDHDSPTTMPCCTNLESRIRLRLFFGCIIEVTFLILPTPFWNVNFKENKPFVLENMWKPPLFYVWKSNRGEIKS